MYTVRSFIDWLLSSEPQYIAFKNKTRSVTLRGMFEVPDTVEAFNFDANMEPVHQFRHDPQNVHDTQINSEISKRFIFLTSVTNIICSGGHSKITERITKLHGHTFWIALRCSYIYVHIINNYTCDIDKLEQVFHFMMNGSNHTVTVAGINAPICDILCMIWDRIMCPENQGVREDLIQALIQQLCDCVQDSSVVCVKGIVGRLFQVFIMLDVSSELSAPITTTQEFQNEALAKTRHILESSLSDFKTGGRSMLDIYTDMPQNLTPEETELVSSFEDFVKTQISDTLRADYEHLVSGAELSDIIVKAQSFM